MKIHVLGAGALGCAIGGTLAIAGSDVTLINSSSAHVDAINARGLRLRDGDTERSVTVHAVTRPNGLPAPDLMIVLVKSLQTLVAIEGALDVIGEHTTVMSLQNGMGHEEILSTVVGAHRVVAGKTYVGGVMLGPGEVIAGARGKRTIIGELDGSSSARITAIAAEFNRAGLSTTVSRNIVGTIWDKLLINVATGALSGITRLPYGDLYRVPEIEACALAAVSEAMAVARAAGVTLSIGAARDAWLMAADGLPSDFRTSMLQSLDRGTPTEIDFINGAVVRAGQRLQIDTPVNQSLVAAIKGIEFHMSHT